VDWYVVAGVLKGVTGFVLGDVGEDSDACFVLAKIFS
jgi:hypothetical protein